MNKWTRKRILDAFTALVMEHGYDEVTVEAVRKKAEVGKTTFYRYFRNKADMLNAHYQDLYDAAIESEQCTTLEDLFTLLFRTTRENPEELSMFDTLGHESYREFIYRYTFRRGKQIIETAWGRPLTVVEEFHVAFFCGGGARMLEEWACGRYREMTSEEAGRESASMVHDLYSVQIEKESPD